MQSGVLETTTGKLLALSYIILVSTIIAGLLFRMSKEDVVLKKTFGKEWNRWAENVPYKLVPGIIWIYCSTYKLYYCTIWQEESCCLFFDTKWKKHFTNEPLKMKGSSRCSIRAKAKLLNRIYIKVILQYYILA